VGVGGHVGVLLLLQRYLNEIACVVVFLVVGSFRGRFLHVLFCS